MAGRNATPAAGKLGYRYLRNTSQGTRLDVPPEDFIEDELLQYDAKRKDGKAAAPALKGDLHPVFVRNNWPDISCKRYNALHQAMLLSTKLLSVSGAYMASFMPEFRQHTTRKMRAVIVPFDDLNPTNNVLLVMEKAKDALRLSSASLKWREDLEMVNRYGWMGLTAPHTCRPPIDEPFGEFEWEQADEDEGILDSDELRSVCIVIMSGYADAILATKPGTAEHLVATFNCGLTMTHELGHYFACTRAGINVARGEPLVGDAIAMELGLGFIAWLFGGWHPESIMHTTHKGPPDFRQGNTWMPWVQRGATKQQLGTAYSMRIEHMEKLMDQASWEGQPVDSKPGQVRKNLLHAPSFGPGKCARIARLITRINGGYGWDESAWAEIGAINWLNFRMLPLEYIDLDWDEKPEDTLKPLTGPNKANYQTAWELDLFPRLRNSENYEMIYKNVCKPTDIRPLLGEHDSDDEGVYFGGFSMGSQPAVQNSQVESPVLQGADLRQLITDIGAARKALQGGVVKIGKYVLPTNEKGYDPKAAHEGARAAAETDATQAEFMELYQKYRANNTTARLASQNFFGTGSRGPRTDSGAPGPGLGRASQSGSGSGRGSGNGSRKRSRVTIDLSAEDDEDNHTRPKSRQKLSVPAAKKDNREVEALARSRARARYLQALAAADGDDDPNEMMMMNLKEEVPVITDFRNSRREDPFEITSSRSKSSSSGGSRKVTKKKGN